GSRTLLTAHVVPPFRGPRPLHAAFGGFSSTTLCAALEVSEFRLRRNCHSTPRKQLEPHEARDEDRAGHREPLDCTVAPVGTRGEPVNRRRDEEQETRLVHRVPQAAGE